jgi:hypothetical protein
LTTAAPPRMSMEVTMMLVSRQKTRNTMCAVVPLLCVHTHAQRDKAAQLVWAHAGDRRQGRSDASARATLNAHKYTHAPLTSAP